MDIFFLEKVKVLRKMTGVGVKICSDVLLKSDCSLDVAVGELRKIGLLKAESISTRISTEGQICVCLSNDKKRAVLIELNTETDYVSRKEEFKSFLLKISNIVIDNFIEEKDNLMSFYISKGISVSDSILDLVSLYGENIFISKYKYIKIEEGFLSSYIHGNNVGKIGAVVHYLGENHDLAYDIAIHVAAMNPLYLDYNSVPLSVVKNEKDIFFSEVKKLYPEKNNLVLNKIVDGKLDKYLSGIVLLEQIFVKSGELKIKDVLNNQIRLLTYFRFEVGK